MKKPLGPAKAPGRVRCAVRRLRSALGRVRRRWRGVPEPAPSVQWYSANEIDDLVRIYTTQGSVEGGPWDPYRHAHMVLPDWFRSGLDPWSTEYARQQHRLWSLIAGVDDHYDPERDEKEFGWAGVDVIRAPGYYMRRDRQAIVAASDHVLATGMLLRHCGLKAGDLALEYGAGFGQSALALARMGVEVDTVDISATFCDFVRQQGEHFQVPLRAHRERFGFNPRPGQKYQLIWFYESFHHCVDFMEMVPRIVGHLADGGRIVLGGEPIVEAEYAAVPYPWGVRLHSEVAAVMRQTHWFELGFSETFLYELFARSDLVGRRVDCEPSLYGRLYIFERTPR